MMMASKLSDKDFLLATKQPIKDMTMEEIEMDLVPILALNCNLAGIKGEIDPINGRDITKMILSRFKSLSIFEINKAFENERYSVYEAKIDHFQLFNADYVGRVLARFKKWKLEQSKKYNIPQIKNAELNAVQQLPEPKKSIEDWANETKETYLKEKEFPICWFRFWREIWTFFHNDKSVMPKYQKHAELILQQEYLQLKGFNKPKPTKTDIKRKMAELSLIELWKKES